MSTICNSAPCLQPEYNVSWRLAELDLLGPPPSPPAVAALASTILGDLILKRPNPYCDLYSPSRLRSMLNWRSMHVSTGLTVQGDFVGARLFSWRCAALCCGSLSSLDVLIPGMAGCCHRFIERSYKVSCPRQPVELRGPGARGCACYTIGKWCLVA
jgi:hypothetical protein